MRLPVHCPTCGGVFLSRGYNISGRNISLWGNIESCIFCGADARLSEGVFNIAEDAVEILTAPETTLEAFKKMRALVADVSAGRITPEEARVQAEAIRPGFGSVVVNWIALNLIGLAALIFQAYQFADAKADNASRDAQIERLIRATEQLQTNEQAQQESTDQASQTKNRKARRAEAAKQRKARKTGH